MKVKKTRNGRSLRIEFHDDHGDCTSSSIWYEFDDLDTKTIDNAENNYEKVFVVLRDALMENGCDDEDARLAITQNLTDLLRQNNLIRGPHDKR
tara:strand:- start:3710 stop:3991 length:282 start_codon:yes stop_codon:yes gene_type:complete